MGGGVGPIVGGWSPAGAWFIKEFSVCTSPLPADPLTYLLEGAHTHTANAMPDRNINPIKREPQWPDEPPGWRLADV